MRKPLPALLPASLLALFGGWCGTFYYGVAATAVIAGHLALLATVAWGWRGWDPLRLGERVIFDPMTTPRGLRATGVRVVK